MEDLVIIACGSRDWIDLIAARQVVLQLPPSTFVIHGNCRGADLTFEIAALERGLEVKAVPADWRKHGVGAGPIRNSVMLNMILDARRAGCRVGVLAFHDDTHLGTGTRDMVRKARNQHVGTIIVTHSPIVGCF